ncbi:MAG: amidase [Lactococcus plantarum]|nr:amidase [Lactococcus plantarum]MDN6071251.1 amidase [Lactococcus plantarum]MDN6085287.1 amidase [Lactococcus plantarum]
MIKDATYFVAQLHTNKTTPEQLLLAAKKKIDELNPNYNAIIAHDIALAKKDINKTKQGYFAGLPFPLKMLGQVHAGLGATACSRLFKDILADTDDNYVTTLLTAGLTPFGQTNSPEFGFKNVTDSALYGDTRNVWNPAYYSGGSSGGAASAVAAGIFPIAGASDGGGSIRIPASFSGLLGLKATRGLMPQGPDNYRGWQGASTSGALTVSVRDTAHFLAEMQVMQEADPYQSQLLDKEILHHLTEIDRPLTIAFSYESPISGIPISNTAKAALHKTIDFLKTQGHQLTEVDFPLDARALIQSYYQMNAAETFAMLTPWEIQQGKKITNEDVEPLTYALLETGRQVDAASYIQGLNLWDNACETFNDKLFKDFDLFLTPTTAKTAPKIGEKLIDDDIISQLKTCEQYDPKQQLDLIETTFESSLAYTPYSFISNLTGQPALSLPVYLDNHTNLPQGVQLWGPKHSEILMLRLALQFENHGQFILPEVYRF